jgi:hypothetical protein
MLLPLPAILATLSLLLFVEESSGQGTGAVSGVVTNAQSRVPVANVLVRVVDRDREVLTDEQGRFQLVDIAAGNRTLVFSHLAYGEHTRSVTLARDSTLQLDVRISQQALELSPLVVETRTQAEQDRRASGNVINEVLFEDIQLAARQGKNLIELLRQQIPNVRLRPARQRNCLEYRMLGTLEECREMTVVMDGAIASEAGSLLPLINLEDLERLEVLSPSEGAARYGNLARNGVLIIETRIGTLPPGPPPALSPGRYDWNFEQRRYPWLRVFTASFLTNAATLAVAYVPIANCTQIMSGSLQARVSYQAGRDRDECHMLLTYGAPIAALVLPGTLAGAAARWAGQTDLSRGLGSRSVAFGAFTNLLGQLVFFTGRARDSGSLELLGLSMIVVGTPALQTISDRYFRSLR